MPRHCSIGRFPLTVRANWNPLRAANGWCVKGDFPHFGGTMRALAGCIPCLKVSEWLFPGLPDKGRKDALMTLIMPFMGVVRPLPSCHRGIGLAIIAL